MGPETRLDGDTESHMGSKHFGIRGLKCMKALRALVVMCCVVSS